MKVIFDYVSNKNQKFYCRDNKKEKELTVVLKNELGKPCDNKAIKTLEKIAGTESIYLQNLYQFCDGGDFQLNNKTIGLRIVSIENLESLNEEWKESFSYYEEEDLYDFQKNGFAFAEIYQSGNYFVMYNGKVFYSDHDGGDDTKWGNSIEDFLNIAFSDPAKFLYDAGCYTRYYDGKSDIQYIPEKLI